ncbi:MAG: VOC family protein [Atopobiaceae bacterium]|nr:VOC family protein [Atopobiaceae bacterium]
MAGKLITGTHHVALKAASVEMFEETLAFYRDVLGLEVLRTAGEGEGSSAMLWTGNSIVELFARGKELDGNGSVNHFALTAPDVDAAVAAVREAGYPITVEPKDVVIASEPPFPIRIAFYKGPCGESVELFCEK